MKIKTAELIGPALDWAVAKCEVKPETMKVIVNIARRKEKPEYSYFYPSTDWAQGGPIIERENIELTRPYKGNWLAHCYDSWHAGPFKQCGPTALIAAMRCYVAAEIGDEVEIPEELRWQE